MNTFDVLFYIHILQDFQPTARQMLKDKHADINISWETKIWSFFYKPNRLLEQLQSKRFSKSLHEVIIIVTSRWLLLEFCMDTN